MKAVQSCSYLAVTHPVNISQNICTHQTPIQVCLDSIGSPAIDEYLCIYGYICILGPFKTALINIFGHMGGIKTPQTHYRLLHLFLAYINNELSIYTSSRHVYSIIVMFVSKMIWPPPTPECLSA